MHHKIISFIYYISHHKIISFIYYISHHLWSILINFADIEEIKRVKEKHISGGKLLEAFMQDPYRSYMVHSGANPYGDGEYDEEIKERVMLLESIGPALSESKNKAIYFFFLIKNNIFFGQKMTKYIYFYFYKKI